MSDIMDMIRIAPTLGRDTLEKRAKRPELKAKPIRPPQYRATRHGGEGRTPSQDEVVAFVNGRHKAGSLPTIDEIRVHMGWRARHSVYDALRKVAARLHPEARVLVRP